MVDAQDRLTKAEIDAFASALDFVREYAIRIVDVSPGEVTIELPFDKRRLFNVLHSVTAGDEVREGVVRLQDYARRGSAATPLRILVADDNPTNAGLLVAILEPLGFEAQTAANGKDALRQALERPPDLVLLDLNLPRKNGRDGETHHSNGSQVGKRNRIPPQQARADQGDEETTCHQPAYPNPPDIHTRHHAADRE